MVHTWKKNLVVGVTSLLVLVVLLIGSSFRGHAPTYKGKGINYWFGELAHGNPEIQSAFHHFGTNSVPFLLKKLKTRDGAFDRLNRLGWRLVL